MADRSLTVDSVNLLTAIGGAITVNDRIFIYDTDTNFTAGDLSGAALDLVLISDDVYGNFGEGGVAIPLDLSGGAPGVLDYAGRGQWAYFEANTTIEKLVVRPAARGVVKITAGTVTDWFAEGGVNSIPAATVVTNLSAVDCSVTAEDNATAFTSVFIDNATLDTDRGATLAQVGPQGSMRMANPARAISRFECAGKLYYAGGNIGGAASVLYPGGELDLSGLRADLTITNAVKTYPGSKIILPRNVTVTWTNNPVGRGADIVYAS